MRPALAVLATLSLPLSAAAADYPAALSDRLLSLTTPDGNSLGTIELKADGLADMTSTAGQRSIGKWQVAADRICIQFPPHPQDCWASARELTANGHASMTNLAGRRINVTVR